MFLQFPVDVSAFSLDDSAVIHGGMVIQWFDEHENHIKLMPQLSKLPDLYSVEHSRGGICLFLSVAPCLCVYKITDSHKVAHYKQSRVQ